MEDNFFTPCKIGQHTLSHHIVLAPMTRIRAEQQTLAPTALNLKYYAQRATSGGLLITEATHISPEATPVWSIYPAVKKHGGHVPGIWTALQTKKWLDVTNAVHEKGGLVCCQLLHAGRVAQLAISGHAIVKNSNLPIPSVSSSVVGIPTITEKGNQYNWDEPAITPRALSIDEISRVQKDYQQAAKIH